MFPQNPNFHHPICNQSHSTGTACWGYAVARVYGKLWSDAVCPAATSGPDEDDIPSAYFQFVVYTLANVAGGDIIEFSDGAHVAYVSTAGQNTETTIKLDYVDNWGGTQKVGKSLYDVINGNAGEGVVARGEPTGIWRRKDIWKATFSNSFGSGPIKVKNGVYGSGVTLNNLKWGKVSVDAIANGGTYVEYRQIFQNWRNDQTQQILATTQQAQLDIVHLINDIEPFSAVFLREFEIRFENVFEGLSNSGAMTINGNPYTLPVIDPFPVVDGSSIQATAINQTINGIYYQFDRWNTGDLPASMSFMPPNHTIYKAEFIGRPTTVLGAHDVGAVGQPIQIVWNQHVNPNVRYRIYRQVKNVSPATLIADLPNNVTSFTDYDYIKDASYTNYLLQYDVRGYYTVEQTEAVSNWWGIYGNIAPKIHTGEDSSSAISAGEMALANFPNPFNPETQIYFHLPESGHLQLDIFDVSGRRVRQLSQQFWTAGHHAITWDGLNDAGQQAPSGVYFGRLLFSGSVKSVKMLLAR